MRAHMQHDTPEYTQHTGLTRAHGNTETWHSHPFPRALLTQLLR